MLVYTQPPLELKSLQPLVGKWNTEGEVVEDSVNCPEKIIGTDSYEWITDGFFLMHTVDVVIGKQHVKAVEMIGGYDHTSKTFQMHSFDNEGKFMTMQLQLLTDNTFLILGNRMRSTLTINKLHMSAHWERTEDDVNWKTWMDIKFTKIAGR